MIARVAGGWAVIGVKPQRLYPSLKEAVAAIPVATQSCSDGGCGAGGGR